ncbi:MAG: YeeE/YedE family protein [Alkaliphilus sp.]|nr:MAG: YeeE/YedE family protein [Alkaliphilus sp.]
MKKAWGYVAGAVLLSVVQVITLASTGSPWGVSGPLMNWGAWTFRLFGGNVNNWHRFSSVGAQATLDAGFFSDPGTIRNLALIFGALLATLLASQFKIKKIKSKKQIIAAVLGGFMMGYGARLAAGCNIGALFSGIASLSLSGWVFALFLFFGAVAGSKILVKYFM